MTRTPADGGATRDAGGRDDPVEVVRHVHFAMTGSFPLRLADLFFADDALYVAEYGHLTPLFGLGTGEHRRAAADARRTYEEGGAEAVLRRADTVRRYAPEALDRVTLHDGGWLGRPRVAVSPATGRGHAYRLHEVPEFDALADAVSEWGVGRGVTVECGSGIGGGPVERLARLLPE
ncbi:hypothetical protein [Halomarina ordinaria]|uniref:SAM-dependent methyltransferase n=1 Tax=Halomarina ordinaria TaxID=3033939 RepID=A0ABD5U9E4_9EURY|nr:hypothetical protein [Halomarina sp. PSRA2]